MGISDVFSKLANPFTGGGTSDAISNAYEAFSGGKQVSKQNAANYALQQQQQNWEEKMSNTAVQRRMTDLRAAGINPLLATGQAADVPNVAPARMEAKPSGASAISSAISAYQTFGASKLLEAQSRKTNAEASVVEQFGGEQAQADIELKGTQAAQALAQVGNIHVDTDLKDTQERVAAAEAQLKELTGKQMLATWQAYIDAKKAEAELLKSGVPAAKARAEAVKGLTDWWGWRLGEEAKQLLPFSSSAIGAGALLK